MIRQLGAPYYACLHATGGPIGMDDVNRAADVLALAAGLVS